MRFFQYFFALFRRSGFYVFYRFDSEWFNNGFHLYKFMFAVNLLIFKIRVNSYLLSLSFA
jgi:hypothetical protein